MDRNFWKRANMQQITEFILQGTELVECDPRDYLERQEENEKDFIKSLHDYREMILEKDWDGLDEKAKVMQDEELYTAAGTPRFFLDAFSLAFEIGMAAGVKLSREMLAYGRLGDE